MGQNSVAVSCAEASKRLRQGRFSRKQTQATDVLSLQMLRTPLLDWVGFAGSDGRVVSVSLGHSSPASVRAAVLRSAPLHASGTVQEEDWNPQLATLLLKYSEEQPVDLSEVPIVWPQLPPFHDRVLRVVQRIPYGQTLSYAEVARRAGSPQAARAVGNCMRNNRLPLLIPCHRVIASNGGLGGFTAPRGAALKSELLELERKMAARGDHAGHASTKSDSL